MKKQARSGITMDDVFRLLAESEAEFGLHFHYVVRRFGNEPRPTLGRVAVIASRVASGGARAVLTVSRELPNGDSQTLEGAMISMLSELTTRLYELRANDDSAVQGGLFP